MATVDVAKLGFEVDSSEAKTAATDLDKLAKSAENAEKAAKGTSAGMKSSEDSVKSLSDRVKELDNDRLTSLASTLEKLSNPLLAIGIAFTAAAAGMIAMGQAAIDAADNLNDLSIGSGRAHAELQALDLIAAKNGTSLDTLLMTLDRVAKNMSKADQESSKAAAAFTFFGVSTTDASGKAKSAEQVTYELAKAYQDSEKSASVAAAAQLVLGANYKEIAAAALGLADKQAELNRVKELGADVDKNLAEASDKYNDTLTDAGLIFKAIGNDMARLMLPLMQAMSEQFTDSASKGGILHGVINALKIAMEGVVIVLKVVAMVFIGLDTAFQLATRSLTAFIAALDALRKGDLAGVRAVGNQLKADIDQIAADANKRLQELFKNVERAKEEAQREATNRGAFDPAAEAERLRALERKAEAERKAREEFINEEERLRKLDAAGWVKYIEELERQWEEEAKAMAKITADRFKEEEKLQKESLARMAKAEEEISKQRQEMYLRELEAQAAVWNELADRSTYFLTDLLQNGTEAFGRLRDMLKDFAMEMIAIFAKKWILSLGASMTGNPVLDAAAGSTGSGSMAGTALSWIGEGAASYMGYAGLGTAGQFAGAFAGAAGSTAGYAIPSAAIGADAVAAGVGVDTMAAAAGESIYGALASIGPYGWVAIAVLAVAAWFSTQGGGPKIGGSFTGIFDDQGEMTGEGQAVGTDNGRLYTPTQGDAQMEQFTRDWSAGFFETLGAFGGTLPGGLAASFGFDTDPEGDAQNRFSAQVVGADGRVIYDHTSEGGRDEGDLANLMREESMRALLAALQASELPAALSEVFNSIADVGTASVEQITDVLARAGALKTLIDLGIQGVDSAAVTALARDGETFTQTAQRIAQSFSGLNNAFMTEGQRLSLAQQQLTDAFAAIGMSVPESNEAFLALVSSLDLSTESGRDLYNTLVQVAPAFQSVSAAAAEMLNNFDSVMGQLRSGYSTQMAQQGLENSTRRFMQGASWTEGSTWQSIAQAVTTITREDFSSYSIEQQQVILEILGYTNQLNQATQHANTSVQTFTGAINSAADAAVAAARAYAEAQAGLRDWAMGKLLGGDSPLSPEERYLTALDEYERAQQSGDIGQFQSAADALLSQGVDYLAQGSDAYTELFNRVMTDAEALGGFNLGRNADPAPSINQMRVDVVTELQLSREENRELRAQVNELILAIRDTSREQTAATIDAANITARAVTNAVETSTRS